MFTATTLTRDFSYALGSTRRRSCKPSPQQADVILKSISNLAPSCFVYVLAKSCLLGMLCFPSQFVEAASWSVYKKTTFVQRAKLLSIKVTPWTISGKGINVNIFVYKNKNEKKKLKPYRTSADVEVINHNNNMRNSQKKISLDLLVSQACSWNENYLSAISVIVYRRSNSCWRVLYTKPWARPSDYLFSWSSRFSMR